MGAALAGLAEVGLAAGEIGATAGEVGATAGEIGATAGEIGTTAGEIGTTAGEIGTTAGEIGEAGTTAGEIGEAGTTAGEIGEAGTTAGEAGEAGTTAGEAGEAGTTAGKAGGMLSKIGPVFEKINKMVMDYIIIDTVFKGAKKILEGFTSDPAAKARLNKLKKLIPVLSASGKILKAVWDWVKVNSNATTDADAVASLKGEWSKFFPDLQKVGLDICLQSITTLHIITIIAHITLGCSSSAKASINCFPKECCKETNDGW